MCLTRIDGDIEHCNKQTGVQSVLVAAGSAVKNMMPVIKLKVETENTMHTCVQVLG